MREHIHSSSLTLPHWLSVTYFEQSAKHHEESTSNLWTIGVWEIILSSFIFPSKLTDPRRNKLDIFQLRFWLQHFNSCPDDSISTPAFNFSILILVLMTASQPLLWLQHINFCPDDSISIHALTFSYFIPFQLYNCFFFLRFTAQDTKFFLLQVPFVSSC